MIINNWHLLENRKWGLRDPRLPLTPAVLLAAATARLMWRRFHGCQGHILGSPAVPERGSGQWAVGRLHDQGAEEAEAEWSEAGVEARGPPAETSPGDTVPRQG